MGVCMRLIDRGLDVNTSDKSGETALHLAARRGFPLIQQLLIEHGADTTARNGEGKSVADFEIDAAGLRQVTEELALFDQLPDEISALDALAYLRIYDELDAAENYDDKTQVRALRTKARILLEDLVFQYRSNPARAEGMRTVSRVEVTSKMRKLHPGEDSL
mgnify:CR=1 FL=1